MLLNIIQWTNAKKEKNSVVYKNYPIAGIYKEDTTAILPRVPEFKICKWELSFKSLSHVWLFATPLTVAHQSPLSMGFSRQEDWSGLPFPSPEDLPNPGIEPGSPALQANSLPTELQGKPQSKALEKEQNVLDFAY